MCVSWQHTAIHPGSGEQLLRNYTHIWQQPIPMSPSKQATKACRRKQKSSLFPGSRGRQWLQVRQYWVVIWTWLHFPETLLSISASSWDSWHMDIFMLLAVLPEVTAFYSPSKLGLVPGSTVDSSHPICIFEHISSLLCTDFMWKDFRSNPASFRTMGYVSSVKPQFLHRATAHHRH